MLYLKNEISLDFRKDFLPIAMGVISFNEIGWIFNFKVYKSKFHEENSNIQIKIKVSSMENESHLFYRLI